MSPQNDDSQEEEKLSERADGESESIAPGNEQETPIDEALSSSNGDNVYATTTSWKETKKMRLNQDSLVFSTRISVALTLCSLFILLDHPNPSARVYPDATWIYITACIVLWLPPRHPLDAVSVLIQSLRMLLGSIVGAALSISCGSLAVLINQDQGRAVFMGCCIAVVTFGYCFLVVRYNLVSDLSASLGLFLFCISLFPFLPDQTWAWRQALDRVFNTWLGCAISLLTSLLVFPRSTRWSLQQHLVDQVEMAGDCVQLLLSKACNVFSDNVTIRNLTSLLEVTRRGADPDEAHEAYTAFFHDSIETNALLDLLKYKTRCGKSSSNASLQTEADRTSSQAFLVVTTVVILDSCIQKQAVFVDSDTMETLNRIGRLIKAMLTTLVSPTRTEASAESLLLELSPIRQLILKVSQDESQSSYLQDLKGILSRTSGKMPVSVSGEGSELFFLQLIEQLILQSLRLHYIWIQNKVCCGTHDASQVHEADVDAQTSVGVQDLPDASMMEGDANSDMSMSKRQPPANTEDFDSGKRHPGGSNDLPATGTDKDSLPSSTIEDVQDVGDSESDNSSQKADKRDDRSEEAVKFGIRMSVTLTLSSLFILLDSPDPSQRWWREGAWVVVSAVVVAWYPTLDAASVVRKTVERIFGTLAAAILGWICGLLAVLIQEDDWRSVFLGICIAIVTFVSALIGYRSEVYNSHQYGSFVGVFTFGIVIFPFTSGDIDSWWIGFYRIINVLIGCLIACFCSILIFPRSTRSEIQRRVTQQVAQAGVSVKMVLSSEDSSEAYETIFSGYKSSRDLFYILGVDPFLKHSERKRTSQFRKEAAMTLARVFRIGTTAMLLEKIKPNSMAMPEFFVQLGTNIETILQVEARDTESVSDEVLSELAQMQPLLIKARVRLSQKSSAQEENFAALHEALCRLDSSSVPTANEECNELLCLLLVEHLVLRALRLYYVWGQNTECTAL